MANTLRVIVSSLCIAMAAAPGYGDEKTWVELQDQAVTLYQAKKYDEAVATARRALEDAEATFGPEHKNVAESLDNLAIYENARGNADEAAKLYERALAILERALPSDDHYLAIFMNYVADFYQKAGNDARAAELRTRAKAIRAKKR